MDKKPIGYKAICDRLNLNVLPHFRESYVTSHGRGKTIIDNHHEIYIYPRTYSLRDEQNLLANLEFALKYDGINLPITKALFERIKIQEVIEYIQRQPTGIYTRKIWYLYEFLMNDKLNLNDCQGLKYVDLLEPKKYFTGQRIKSPRHAVFNNLLGNNEFCPFVRRTVKVEQYISQCFDEQVKVILKKYDPMLVSRASNYLYSKETMSSFQIEREQPDKSRLARFVQMLHQAPRMESLTKDSLIALQNTIVDPRFKDADYRYSQNYVGENINPYSQKIHYISPKPEDVPELMQGLLSALDRMMTDQIHPVIIAAVISFGFVFIHPFEDGNGRIHRFLIHYILAKKDFTPKDMIFPISAIMLKNMHEYDAILETFSNPLMSILTNYDLSDDGVMKVEQDSKLFYQYPDFTLMVEYLFACIEEAIHNYIEQEIKFLINYDKVKNSIQRIVDMPDNLIDLFIKLVIQNKGKLSLQKQKKYFSLLREDEIEKIVNVIKNTMLKDVTL